MRVAVTLVDRVVGSAVTDDGRHAVLRMMDMGGEAITLGIECNHLPELIESSSWALTESERVRHERVIPAARAQVTWWTSHIDQESGDLLLSLTFGTCGSLCFALPRDMAVVLNRDLAARLEQGEPERRGFGCR